MKLQRLRRRLTCAQRFPPGAACHRCGWADARALVGGSAPLICYACRRERRGRPRTEGHHVGGRGNPHGRVVHVDANVHRILSDRQLDRPADLLAPLVAPDERARWPRYFEPVRDYRVKLSDEESAALSRLFDEPWPETDVAPPDVERRIGLELDRLRILADFDAADVRELVAGDQEGARELRRCALWTYRGWRLRRAWDSPGREAA